MSCISWGPSMSRVISCCLFEYIQFLDLVPLKVWFFFELIILQDANDRAIP
jgi:hypothetical protein